MRKRKTLEELTLADDFMFSQVMSRTPIAQQFLEDLFNLKIGDITFVGTQVSHKNGYEDRGVRFDVEFHGDGRLYNIEMQQSGSAGPVGIKRLLNRSRLYHVNLLQGRFKEGSDYQDLPATIVVFVCTFDPFGLGEARYTQMQYLHGYPSQPLPGETTVYLNTVYRKGTRLNPYWSFWIISENPEM